MTDKQASISVSVIVPFYNCEPFFEQCLHSLFQQTLANIQYIFIDDCSTDNSYMKLQQVIEQYPERKKQTTLLTNKTNQGPAHSRYLGFCQAKGEFIICLDADDWCELDMLLSLYDLAVQQSADIAVMDYYMVAADGTKYKVTHPHSTDQADNIQALISDRIDGHLASKLMAYHIYKTIYQDVRNQECPMRMGEDKLLSIQAYFLATKVCHIGRALYFYRQDNPNSLTSNLNADSIQNLISSLHTIQHFLESQPEPEQYRTAFKQLIWKQQAWVMRTSQPRLSIDHFAEILNLRTLWFDSGFSIAERIIFTLYHVKFPPQMILTIIRYGYKTRSILKRLSNKLRRRYG